MKIQKSYIQILCLGALFNSSILAMKPSVKIPTVPSSWMAKGFSFGVTPQGQAATMPQATVSQESLKKAQAKFIQDQQQTTQPIYSTQKMRPSYLFDKPMVADDSMTYASKPTPRSRFMDSINALRSKVSEEEPSEAALAEKFKKDVSQKYGHHISWVNSNLNLKMQYLFEPLLSRYHDLYSKFIETGDEKVKQELTDLQMHMDQFEKHFWTNRPSYVDLIELPKDFINNDSEVLEIRNNGLQGTAAIEKVIRNYKYGSSGLQSGMFKASGTQRTPFWGSARGYQSGMFKSTAPRLMSHWQAERILGVSENASIEEIENAYKKAGDAWIESILKKHPDKEQLEKEFAMAVNARHKLLEDIKYRD